MGARRVLCDDVSRIRMRTCVLSSTVGRSVRQSRHYVSALWCRDKNANLTIEYDDCGMWRLVYSLRKLYPSQRSALEKCLSGMSFSCGAPLQELDLGPELCELVLFVLSLVGIPLKSSKALWGELEVQ